MILCCAATAALGTLPGPRVAHAFVPGPRGTSSPARSVRSCAPTALGGAVVDRARPRPFPSPTTRPAATRLYSSRRGGGDGDDDGNFLQKAASAAKSILPKSWFKTDEEKKAELARKRVKDEISGGLTEVLKDAPLAVRMMGKMIAPLASKLVSGLSETMKEQADRMEVLLDDARSLIVSDPAASDALGEPIVVGSPFSQSSSTMNVNGRTTSRVQASFEVMGSKSSGVATFGATEDGIGSLNVNVNGRTYNINTSSGGGTTVVGGRASQSTIGQNRINKGDVIDVEFTEKK